MRLAWDLRGSPGSPNELAETVQTSVQTSVRISVSSEFTTFFDLEDASKWSRRVAR